MVNPSYNDYVKTFKEAARDLMIFEDMCDVLANEVPEDVRDAVLNEVKKKADARRERGEI